MVILGTLILDNLILTLIHHNFGGCFSNGTWPRIVKTQERERERYTYIHRSVYIYIYVYIYMHHHILLFYHHTSTSQRLPS